jgi:CheY-like chemotaxis protein
MATVNKVNLVWLDLKMPGLNGQETLEELAVLRPGLPVIMMSGYSGQQCKGGLAGVGALCRNRGFPGLLEAIKNCWPKRRSEMI